MRPFVEAAFKEIGPDTPMSVARERFSLAGALFGKCLAVCISDESGVDQKMKERILEEEGRRRFEKSTTQMLGPGGRIREIWEKQRKE
jgi:hypothetical protein